MQEIAKRSSAKKTKVWRGRVRNTMLAMLAALLMASPVMAYAVQSNNAIDESVATRPALESIVGAQVDSVYGSIEDRLADYASQTITSVIGSRDLIKTVAKPLLTSTIKAELEKINVSSARVDELVDQSVDKVINNDFVNKVLDHEFTQAVIARIVEYAAADIVAQLGISADRDATIVEITDHVWNASLKSVGTASTKVKSDLTVIAAAGGVVNTSYYDFSVVSWNTFWGIKTTPKEINVSGWNTANINTYIAGTVGLSAASKYNEYTSALGSMNYQDIIINAAERAVKDEIIYRVDKLCQDAKVKVVQCIEDKLAKVGVAVNLNPTDSFRKIASDVEAAVKAKAATSVKLTVEKIWQYLLA